MSDLESLKTMYVITVDGLPPTLNAFYSGMHFRKRAKIAKDWHLIFLAAFREAKLPKPLKWPVTMQTTEFCKSHVRDAESACIANKLAQDALVEGGYLPDDTIEYIPTVILSTKKGKSDKTVIQIL